jgi:hypothetical protein
MSADKLGRGFGALSVEEQIRALRDEAITQGVLVYMLLAAVQKLGVTFTKDGVPIDETEDDE